MEMDTTFLKDWDFEDERYLLHPTRRDNMLVNRPAFQRWRDMAIHHWNMLWEDSGMLWTSQTSAIYHYNVPQFLHSNHPADHLLLSSSICLFTLDLKPKQIPSYGTHWASKVLEDKHNRKMHQQSCRILSKSFGNYIDVSRNYQYHLNTYNKNIQPALYSITSWIKMTELVSNYFHSNLKKKKDEDFEHSKSLVLSGSQVGGVFSNSYPVPPDWTSCCLLFVKWQLPKRAQMCFLPVKDKKSRTLLHCV